ncbi:MAG: hypothetical protein AAF213_09175 [Pseudomonadota bacterium]
MRIKSFTAPSMGEVMEQVKSALGEEAIIVTTKEDKDAGLFRVTAALDDGGDDGYDTDEAGLDQAVFDETDGVLENPLEAADNQPWDGDTTDDDLDDENPPDLDAMLLTPEALASPTPSDEASSGQASSGQSGRNTHTAAGTSNATKPRATAKSSDQPPSRPRPLPDWVRTHEEPDFIHQLADSCYSLLIDHGTPRRLARVIGDRIDEELARVRARHEVEPSILEALTYGLRRQFSFQTPADLWTDQPLIMVGPYGSGKTLALAKMAARAVLRGLTPVVITTDVVRAGAIEQLSAFTRIMNIDLKTADDPAALGELINNLPDERHQVLIDTAAVNPFDQDAVDLLGEMVSIAKAEPLIVLAAGTDAVEAGMMATALRAIGGRHLVVTRLDAASRFGSLLAAADLGRLHFAYLGRSTSVTAGLQEAQPETLAELLATTGGVERQ